MGVQTFPGLLKGQFRYQRNFYRSPVTKIEVCKLSAIAIDVSLGVGGEQDWADKFHTRRVSGTEPFPLAALAGGYVYLDHYSRHFRGAIDVNEAAIGAPADRKFAGTEAGNRTRLTAVERIHVSLLIGADSGHEFVIR